MDNLEEFLGATPEEGEAVTEAPEAEAQAEAPEAIEGEETPAEKAARERDEKGRFKAKEAEEPVMVPLKALHETRDELKALKAELEQLRQPTAQPQQVQTPDIFEDTDGFVASLDQRLNAVAINTTLNVSEGMMRDKVGDETVDGAMQWGQTAFQQNPALYQQFLQQRNPYGFLVEQFTKASTFAKLGDDPSEIEAYLAWKQGQSQPQPAPVSQPVPTSLADAQGARGGSTEPLHVPTLDEILKR